MSAKFYQRTINSSKISALGSRSFKSKFFIASPSDFTIDATKRKTATTWGNVYGTNASFFMPQADNNAYMTALHIVGNKSIGAATNNPEYVLGGDRNTQQINDNSTAMDFIYYTGSKVGIKKAASWSTSNNQGISTIKWAVGGFNLLLDSYTISKKTFNENLEDHYPNISSSSMKRDIETSRTLIGYRKNSDEIVLAVIMNNGSGKYYNDGPTMHECHLIMKYLGCTIALCLDGSNATQIRYKDSNGKNWAVDDGRCPWSRIRLTDSAAEKCNWTLT